MVLGWPLHPAPHCTQQQLCLAAAWQHQHCSTAALQHWSAVAGLSSAPGAGTCSPVQCQPTSPATNLQNLRLANLPLPPCLVPAWHRPTRSGVAAGHVSRVTCHVSGAGRLTPNNYSVAGAGKLSAAVWSVATGLTMLGHLAPATHLDSGHRGSPAND